MIAQLTIERKPVLSSFGKAVSAARALSFAHQAGKTAPGHADTTPRQRPASLGRGVMPSAWRPAEVATYNESYSGTGRRAPTTYYPPPLMTLTGTVAAAMVPIQRIGIGPGSRPVGLPAVRLSTGQGRYADPPTY